MSNVEVRRDGLRVGTLVRTRHGSVFEYSHDARPIEDEEGIAFNLPYATRRFETTGVNLHSFFAGLLPEGLRLRALVRRLKKSEDDLLGLLVATGGDCVGDVSVVPEGAADVAPEPTVDTAKLDTVRFRDLFEQSIAYAIGRRSREPNLPGVQEKVSAAMVSFPVRGPRKERSYILKLNPPDKPLLVENEYFFMRAAAACGIDAARVTLVSDRDGAPGLLVERFDRVWLGGRLRALHQEDSCQLLDRYPADKYDVACREIGDALVRVCSAPAIEALHYLRLWAFSYAIGNGDLHAKNVSVRRCAGRVGLTPAYDLLTTLPYGDRRMALKLGARHDNLRRRDFVRMGEQLGVRAKATAAMLDELGEALVPWVERLPEIGFDARRTADLGRTMCKRVGDIARRD